MFCHYETGGLEAAVAGNINVNSPNVEAQGGGLQGIGGQVVPILGRFNGLRFMFHKIEVIIDVIIVGVTISH